VIRDMHSKPICDFKPPLTRRLVLTFSKPNPEERTLAKLLVELGDPLGTLSLQYQEDPASDQPENSSELPSWQVAAPKADLYIDKEASSGGSGKEPYPKKFEEIIAFLQTGKEIPGIRKIPDTIIEDPSITSHGRLKAPPKPWEIGRTSSSEDAAALT
jgi:hypothetical protein